MNDAQMIRQHKAHTSYTPDGVVIRIGRDLVDVFTGSGWASRSRYRLTNGKWEYQVGARLTAQQRTLLPVSRAK